MRDCGTEELTRKDPGPQSTRVGTKCFLLQLRDFRIVEQSRWSISLEQRTRSRRFRSEEGRETSRSQSVLSYRSRKDRGGIGTPVGVRDGRGANGGGASHRTPTRPSTRPRRLTSKTQTKCTGEGSLRREEEIGPSYERTLGSLEREHLEEPP